MANISKVHRQTGPTAAFLSMSQDRTARLRRPQVIGFSEGMISRAAFFGWQRPFPQRFRPAVINCHMRRIARSAFAGRIDFC